MRMYDLIAKKRNGETLTEGEIRSMIDGYVRGEIPDYQMSAMLMAIYFKGAIQKLQSLQMQWPIPATWWI